MVTAYLERYATPAGLAGVSVGESGVSTWPPRPVGWRPRGCSSERPATCRCATATGSRSRPRAWSCATARRSRSASCPAPARWSRAAAADLRARPPPRRVRRHGRGCRRAHPCAVLDRRRLRARRAAGDPLPAAAARRNDPGRAVRHLRHARARRQRPRRAGRPPGRADGQPRLGRRRRHHSRRPSSTRCCSSGSRPCTTGPARSATPKTLTDERAGGVITQALRRNYGNTASINQEKP